jgi:adenylate cyclase
MSVRTLTRDELAAETGADVGLLDQLVRLAVLRPDDRGCFSSGDVVRVEAVRSFLAAGVTLGHVQAALESGQFTLEFLDRFYPEPAPRSTLSLRELASTLGVSLELLSSCYLAAGLPEPPDGQPLREDEAQLLRDFVELWRRGGPDALVRAARLVGEPARQVAEGWTRLYVQRISEPLAAGMDTAERIEAIVTTTEQATRLAPRMLEWLLVAHLRHAIDQANIEGLEAGLAEQGLLPPTLRDVPAVAFVDLSGYTRMTVHDGDDVAVQASSVLRDQALRSARSVGGRLVKLLGDGAMLWFPDALSAVQAVQAMMDALARQGLPAHAGIHAGAVVEHDGDYYGSTVNIAARVASVAAAGQVVVTAEALSRVGSAERAANSLGPVPLKGLPHPIELYLLSRTFSAAGVASPTTSPPSQGMGAP